MSLSNEHKVKLFPPYLSLTTELLRKQETVWRWVPVKVQLSLYLSGTLTSWPLDVTWTALCGDDWSDEHTTGGSFSLRAEEESFSVEDWDSLLLPMTWTDVSHPFSHPVSFWCPAQSEVQEAAERVKVVMEELVGCFSLSILLLDLMSIYRSSLEFASQHTVESMVLLCLPVTIKALLTPHSSTRGGSSENQSKMWIRLL